MSLHDIPQFKVTIFCILSTINLSINVGKKKGLKCDNIYIYIKFTCNII